MFTHHDDAEEVEKLRDYANPNDVIVLWYSLWGSFPIAVACSLNSLGSTCRCTLSTSALSGRGATQDLLRDANPRSTFTHAIPANKRKAKNRVMGMLLEAGRKAHSKPSKGAEGAAIAPPDASQTEWIRRLQP